MVEMSTAPTLPRSSGAIGSDGLVETLIAAGKILQAEGHGDYTRGHISVRAPDGGDRFYMKPHSFGFEEITSENLVICDRDGTKVGGGGRRHSEVVIHSEIYRRRPDVKSIVHSHPPFSVAFSSSDQILQAYSQASAVFSGDLPVFIDTIDLIRTKEQGERLAEVLGSANALLLKGHGIVTAGRSIQDAVMLALMLETACRIHMTVAPVRLEANPPFPREDILSLRKKILSHDQQIIDFDYMRRKHHIAV